jgi:hypothetical protein
VRVIGVVRVETILPDVTVAETFGVEFIAELSFGFHVSAKRL